FYYLQKPNSVQLKSPADNEKSPQRLKNQFTDRGQYPKWDAPIFVPHFWNYAGRFSWSFVVIPKEWDAPIFV
ncbi:MAG: hypothetical protein KDE53_19910, partial [Caldilineaceae bacterium]|nr:hypothetical protein [Caldilineaceae bacterium]